MDLVAIVQKSRTIDWTLFDAAVERGIPWINPGRSIERNLLMGRYVKAGLLRFTEHES
jgi:hypothetical protein